MASDVQGEVALVTGARRGIGRSIALRLARDGYDLALVSRSAPREVAAEIEAEGGRALALAADVGDLDQVQRAVARVRDHLGPVHVLVNNAGIRADGLLLRMKPDTWDQVMATNLRGAFLMTRAVLRTMLRRRQGSIINMTSVVGVIGNGGQANYAASKAGLIGFTRALAKEVASRQVRVNAVAPGFVDTDMTRALPEENRASLLQAIALGRFGRGDDVAGVVSFLASRRSSYVTGQVLHVNGGLYTGIG